MNTGISRASAATCHGWSGGGDDWSGVEGCCCGGNRHGCHSEMRAENQVEAPFGQRTSVGGFEKVSIRSVVCR